MDSEKKLLELDAKREMVGACFQALHDLYKSQGRPDDIKHLLRRQLDIGRRDDIEAGLGRCKSRTVFLDLAMQFTEVSDPPELCLAVLAESNSCWCVEAEGRRTPGDRHVQGRSAAAADRCGRRTGSQGSLRTQPITQLSQRQRVVANPFQVEQAVEKKHESRAREALVTVFDAIEALIDVRMRCAPMSRHVCCPNSALSHSACFVERSACPLTHFVVALCSVPGHAFYRSCTTGWSRRSLPPSCSRWWTLGSWAAGRPDRTSLRPRCRSSDARTPVRFQALLGLLF